MSTDHGAYNDESAAQEAELWFEGEKRVLELQVSPRPNGAL